MFHLFGKIVHCLAWWVAVSCGRLCNILKNTSPPISIRVAIYVGSWLDVAPLNC